MRIADFGFSTFFDPLLLAEEVKNDIVCGTMGYIAPEALLGHGFTMKSDIFSVGSILFNILAFKNLFAGNYYEVMKKNSSVNLSRLEKGLKRCSP